jgi:D-lyxose ketol-isomerase
MKRSDVNRLIDEALSFFDKHKFKLPHWACWTANDWHESKAEAAEVFNHGLGWNLTDFGSGQFDKQGLLLFIIRNGLLKHNTPQTSKTYAEKAMIVRPGQVTPWHFHWMKTEDLINRGGGRLEVELGWVNEDEKSIADRPVVVQVDGVSKKLATGEKLVLEPGESVCIPPMLCHQFCGCARDEAVLAGEVSSLNDDSTDNCFIHGCGARTIEEDVDTKYLLLGEYEKAKA